MAEAQEDDEQEEEFPSEDEVDDDTDLAEREEMDRLVKESHTQGGHVAESGVIERVELVNFMCHKRLTVTLGSQVNFIIGHNGSGKSAVLTGITIALGGKAASTNRGNSLKSFVKEGSTAAEVVLWIKNRGPEAFKHDVYGDRIIVERRINADGGGHWKMKNAQGKMISSKRDELNAFCDHTNIQVDNPMNVLTQDSARQFLSSSNSGEMYDFFLRGTQLKQLSDEYEMINTNVMKMKRTVAKKEEALPDLENAAREAASRYQLVEKQKDQHKKLQEHKNMLVWSQVTTKERERDKLHEQTERSRSKLDKNIKDLERLQGMRAEINEKIMTLETRGKNDGDRMAPLQQERDQIKSEIRALKGELIKARNEEKDQSAQYSNLMKTADDLQRRIDDEAAKLANNNQGKREALDAKHREAKERKYALDVEEAEIRDQLREADPKIKAFVAQEAEALSKRSSVRDELEQTEALCQRLTATSKNSMEAFGASIPNLLRSINSEGRWHQKPVGPIGKYVKLKDPKWAPVLESVIGNTLNAFCVVDHHDRRILEELKRRHGARDVTILTGSNEAFDFSSGEAPQGVLTILRVLAIENDYILRQLVNSVHIEAAALVDRRVEGDELMRQGLRNVRYCFSGDMYRVGGGQVGSTTMTLNPYKGPPRLSSDVQDRLKQAQAYGADLQKRVQAADAALREIATAKKQVEDGVRSNRQRLGLIAKKLAKAKDEMHQIEEDMREDEPANVAALEDSRREAREELDRSREAFAAIQARKEEVEQELRPNVERSEELKRQIDSFADEAGAVKHELEKAIAERLTSQATVKQRTAAVEKHQADLKLFEEQEADKQMDLDHALEQAFEYTDGERVKADRATEYYEREIEALEKNIERARREGGGSLEQVVAEYRSRQRAYDEAKRELDDMKAAIKALTNAMSLRLAMWQQFRQHISLRARSNFTYHLSVRGYTGSLHFNHDAQKLSIKVQTEDSNGANGGRPSNTAGGGRGASQLSKDPKSLSGGEKSFSTICLLLSLWEAIGCPIRCLDEFDVFMDAVNRKISMKMLIDTAKTSYNVQYVLITPQAMSNVKFGPEVHVVQLKDPERGQGILNFGS